MVYDGLVLNPLIRQKQLMHLPCACLDPSSNGINSGPSLPADLLRLQPDLRVKMVTEWRACSPRQVPTSSKQGLDDI